MFQAGEAVWDQVIAGDVCASESDAFEAAVEMEKDLTEDLRRAGYTVVGGHGEF